MVNKYVRHFVWLFLALLGMTQSAQAADFKDFSVIVNNQTGTLLTAEEQTQGTAVEFGVAVNAEGETVRVAADDASSVATVSGKYHSEHGCTGLKVVTAVPGAVKILVGQCTYSGKDIIVTNSKGETVATATPTKTCWKNDRSSVTELVYDGEATTLTITGPDYCPFVAVKKYVAPAEFQSFSAIVNNQDGTLLTAEETATQYTAVNFGVAVKDGQTVRVAADDASAIATISGKFHSDHGMTGLKVITAVPGAVKILVGQCTYSSKDIVVTNKAGETVATATPAQACWKNDHNNVTELIYEGEATTLTITGPDYCPFVAVEKIEAQAGFADFEITNAELSGAFDASKLPAGVTFTGKQRNDSHGYGNVTLTVPVTGKVTFTIGGCQYANPATCKITNAEGEVLAEPNLKTATCYHQDGAAVTYVYKGEPTTLTFSNIAYLPYFKAVGEKEKEKITLKDEASTVTFAFNEGTTGQKAEFTNNDHYLSSKVVVGSNWFIKDKTTYADLAQTRLEPVDQHNSNLTDDDAVSFIFTPKPGFTFTPTKVGFKANRFGTDNGLIDAYWLNADGTTVELDKEIKPERNNSGVNTVKSYDVTGATAGEGACGLKLFLYHLQAAKQIGLADIVIEGILNGTEKDVPVLASFKVNGNEYAVEDVFGEQYEATLKLPKAEKMVGKSNPLTDLTATTGEVGEPTYDEQDDACVVTIPMTAGETQMDYVLNVIFKPDYKLEYIGVDGSVLATQTVEEDAAIEKFGYDINDVAATKDGYKARGWFKTAVLGEKYTTADIITADTKLYAIQTEMEESSTHKKYIFDLTSKTFYAEDHEAFNPAGDGYYWHDGQHGWAFKNGNTVDLLVGPKAIITITLCQYGSGSGIVVKKDGQTLETLEGKSEGDGGSAVYNYEGEAGTLTLEMQCGGEMYIHGIKVVNVAEVNFENKGDWYFVKAGDASSLLDVIDVVNGKNARKDAARAFIFVPNGTYDLDATVKTAITGNNISIIGESMEGTRIVTAPDKSIEGLGKADMFQVSGSNLYLQDLTLQNALDYYAAGSAGRAAVIQDSGNRTIGKNVRMLSYQDTYYSSNSSQQAYWENCDIHGTVDFICGGGDIRFQNTTISLEPRAKDGKGGRTVVAPTTNTQFGYVFDGCTVVDLAEGKGDWNFGRTWQNTPITVYLNTTLDENAQKTLVASRWTQKGMNNKDPKLFGEYGTKDAAGNDITPESNIITSFGGTFETIITAEQAANYSYERMFSENAEKAWDPAALTAQAIVPFNIKLEGKTLTWEAKDDVIAWAIVKDGKVIDITTTPSYTVDDASAAYTVRAANQMGGLSEIPANYAAINFAEAGYATFFDSENNYAIPTGVKAFAVSEATTDKLTYTEIETIIPAGTAVMLEQETKTGGQVELPAISMNKEYTGANLLYGSDKATTTFADGNSRFYKLSYGKSNTAEASSFGWYWGAEGGAAFQIEGHRAWLAIPEAIASAPGFRIDGSTTGISEIAGGQPAANGQYYNLNGQRVASPQKGLYIINNKKIVVK